MQLSAWPWPHGLRAASFSGFSGYEKVTTPAKVCLRKMENTNHRIIEPLELEGTLLHSATIKDHLLQIHCNECDISSQIRLLTAPFSPNLDVSRDGPSTTFLGSLFQCFTIPTVKKTLLCLLPELTEELPVNYNGFKDCFL